MPSYLGQAPGLGRQEFFHFTATASQTTFTGTDDNGFALSYTPGQVVIFLDGVMQDPADYTASNGTSVVLASGATAGQLLSVLAFGAWSPADALSKASGGVVQGPILNPGARGCFASRSTSAGAYPSGTYWKVDFQNTRYNTEGAAFSVSGQNAEGAHYTVPAGVSLIRVTTGIQLSAGGPSGVWLRVELNGGVIAETQSPPSFYITQTTTGALAVSPGDLITALVWHNVGSNQTASTARTFISIEIIG